MRRALPAQRSQARARARRGGPTARRSVRRGDFTARTRVASGGLPLDNAPSARLCGAARIGDWPRRCGWTGPRAVAAAADLNDPLLPCGSRAASAYRQMPHCGASRFMPSGTQRVTRRSPRAPRAPPDSALRRSHESSGSEEIDGSEPGLFAGDTCVGEELDEVDVVVRACRVDGPDDAAGACGNAADEARWDRRIELDVLAFGELGQGAIVT